MTVLQVCAYAAPYEGNFMNSLFMLEKKLREKGIKTIYAFPHTSKDVEWCKKLSKRTKVYFLPLAKARIKASTYNVFARIYKENPDIKIVHSHFELYDVPATVTAPKQIKIFWHLHDSVELNKGIHKYIWKLQYGYFSSRAQLLSVSEKYKDDIVKLGFNKEYAFTIPNGIDLSRIVSNSKCDKKYTFLTFGWDFYTKGDDIIIKACKKLEDEGYTFKFLINGDKNTIKLANEYCNNYLPQSIEFCEFITDVNSLFSSSSVFVQASRRETFSYSVCEAAYSGLPIICSNIPGLLWTSELPTSDFFESENSTSLYCKMKEYLDGKKYSEELYNETRKIIIDKYTIDSWSDKIIQYYGC